MQNGNPTDRLVRFVEYMSRARRANAHDLTTLDVQLECRAERLAEYSEWPASELDAIEQEAVSYGTAASLAEVLSGDIQPTSAESDSWLNSPSAFAWM